MSVNFLYEFHLKLHNLLSTEVKISKMVDKIYISVVQDAKYPFLLINMLSANNISKFTDEIYEVEFEICIFSRDKNQGNLTLLADLIKAKLNLTNSHFIKYIIAGIRLGSVSFERSSDLITTKLIMNYKALIKQSVE